MELLHYLFKSSLVLSLFFAVYSIFLKKDTHFQWHRWFLATGILLSYSLPLFVFTRVIYIAAPITTNNTSFIETGISITTQEIHWSQFIIVFYLLGLLIMGLRFLHQCYTLYKIIHSSTPDTIDGSPCQETEVQCMPFSFFKYIIINKKLHSKEELSMMVIHENVHSSQYHTLDILLSNLLLIGQWWNPMAWFYKKSMEENLEFIADAETIKTTACPKTYQYTLVKNTVATLQPALATHFYQSLIKKRIIMLNKTASTNISRWKTLLVLPLIALFFWNFNMEAQIKFEQQDQETTRYIVKPETTNKELKSIEKMFKPYKTQIKFTGVKRNKKKNITEITVKTRRSLANSFKHGMTLENKLTKGIDTFTLHIDPSSSDIILSSLIDDHPFTATFTEKGSIAYVTDTETKVTSKNDLSKALHILDEEEVSSKIVVAINPENIKSMNVLTGNNAIKKYGSKGENGVIEISTKSKNLKVGTSENSKPTFKFTPTNSISENISEVPLYILEGKEVSGTSLKNIIPNDIKSISVLKNKKATDKYGRKGENGVIEISTKAKNLKVGTSENSKPTFKFTPTNSISENISEVPLYILEGKEVSSEIIEAINPDQMHAINVLKGSNATEKYGSKGKNGVVEITLKSSTKHIPKNVLYIVDGKETNTMEDLDRNTIKDISVLKGKNATDLYGKKGKDGVVIITTKKEK